MCKISRTQRAEGCSGSTYSESKGYSNTQLKTLEKRRKAKCRKNTISKKTKPRKARFAEQKIEKGAGYGSHCETNDITPHLFNIKEKQFMQTLAEDQTNRDVIEATTRGQTLNRKWKDLQYNLLTTSYFSSIVNAKSRKSYSKILDDIIYKK